MVSSHILVTMQYPKHFDIMNTYSYLLCVKGYFSQCLCMNKINLATKEWDYENNLSVDLYDSVNECNTDDFKTTTCV